MSRQIFKGHFSYLLSDPEGTTFKQDIPFEMSLDFKNDTFKGTLVDDETKGLFEKPITVNGFVEADQISFVVMYPHNYWIDKITNQVIIDYQNDYPGCQYIGVYNLEADKYEGEWTITVKQNKTGNWQTDTIDIYISGTWEMQRVE